LDHAQEVFEVILPPDGDSAVVLKPGEKSLDFPSSSISSKWPSILGFGSLSAYSMRGDHLDADGCQPTVQGIGVIGLVADDSLGKPDHEPPPEGLFDQGHFMRRSAGHVDGDRKTSSVCNCHDLGALATLSFANSRAPFLAGEKLPSMKASRMSSPPLSLRSSTSARRTSSNTPPFDHFWCQRWQVDLGGYRSGKSCHWAPVRRIHRIPLSTSRGSRRDRPRGSVRSFGISGSITDHCSSVKSIHVYKTKLLHKSRFYFGMGSRSERRII